MTDRPESDQPSSYGHLTVPSWVVICLGSAAGHWRGILAGLILFYVGLSFLAPVAMRMEREGLAQRIYGLYSLTCHQLPASSLWLFGEEAWFQARLSDAGGQNAWEGRTYLGTRQTGFKSGMCWRTLGIYAAAGLLLLIYPGSRFLRSPLPLWAGGLLMLPMAADGISQMLELRTSTQVLRVLTGSLFSLGVVWAVAPRVDEAMREVAAGLRPMSSPS